LNIQMGAGLPMEELIGPSFRFNLKQRTSIVLI